MEFSDAVDARKIIIRRFTGDIEFEKELGLGDCVEANMILEVVGINHSVNQRTGALSRVYDMKIKERTE